SAAPSLVAPQFFAATATFFCERSGRQRTDRPWGARCRSFLSQPHDFAPQRAHPLSLSDPPDQFLEAFLRQDVLLLQRVAPPVITFFRHLIFLSQALCLPLFLFSLPAVLLHPALSSNRRSSQRLRRFSLPDLR